MRRKTAVVLMALLVPAVAAGRAAFGLHGTPDHVYTVAQVNAGLAQHPAVWVGRTISIRGRAVISLCPGAVSCAGTSALLVDLRAPSQHIRLTWSMAGPLLSTLLDIPYVNTLVARRVGGVGVYRVLISRATRIVPAGNLPNYYPYTSKTAPVSDDSAVLVNGLN